MDSSDKLLREHTPLLRPRDRDGSYGSIAAGDEKSPDVAGETQDAKPAKISTPLPMKQLLLVFFMRLAEPIAYSQIFPYINEMMEDIGAVDDPKRAGHYSGLIESAFAIAELLTVLRWGSLSDRIGRKPVLLIGFIGAMLSTVLFGLSKSFLWALFARCLAGALSGNIPVLLSAVGDMTDETNQVRAYAIFGVANNVAQMAGPSIGGTFANPAVTFPKSFGRVVLFQKFPFLLPCVISALIALIAACCAGILFKETHRREPSKSNEDASQHHEVDETTTWNIATDPVMLSVLIPFFLLSILSSSLTVVFSLFSYTPVSSGGLSRSPEEIGLAIASAGLIGAVIQVTILPELQRLYGTIPLYRFFMSLWPLLFLSFPVLNAIARHMSHRVEDKEYNSHPAGLAVWSGVALLLSINRLATMAFSLNLILTKSATPSISVLGKVFAVSHFVNCAARAIAPSFVSSLFAVSKERDVFGGNFVWVVMCAISLLGIWATFEARDGLGES